jgi:hypothetical protein
MRECDTERKNSGDDEIVPGGRMPMNLHEVLCPEAQEELARDGITELVSVSVRAVPDPERIDDRLAMKVTAEVCDNFRAGIPAIDRDLDRVDAISSSSGDDLSLSVRNELLVALDTRRREFAGLREGKMNGQPVAYLSDPAVAALIGPSLENPVINDLVWSLGWCATREENGKLLAYCEAPLFSEYADDDSWVRIQDRIRRVNYLIGGIVAGLLEEQ